LAGGFGVTDFKLSEQGRLREPRTNMFVLATLYAGGASAPVKIRNLSPTGALIEGKRIPPPATKVSLRRGSLAVSGQVMWCGDGRAGLNFEAPAAVAHWLPGGEALIKQARVDAIFNGSGGLAASDAAPDATTPFEIVKVQRLLLSLAEALADDAQAVVRYAAELQALDVAAELLAQMATRHGASRLVA
jgi:hypothetical protein